MANLTLEELNKLPDSKSKPSVLSVEELGKLPTPTEKEVSSTPDVSKFKGLSENDLMTSEVYDTIILPHLNDFFPSEKNLFEDRERGVNLFMNKMRGVNSGNLYRAGREIEFVTRATEEEKARAGAAYQLYEGMENIFTGEGVTGGEKLEAIGDYARTVILDPTNLLAFVGGKIWATGGTKSASRLAQKAAMKAYKNTMKNQIAAGATREVASKAAVKAGQKLFNESMQQTGKVVAQNQAARLAEQEAAKTLLQKATTSATIREVVGSTAVGGLSTLAADAMQQRAYIDTDVQEAYNISQAGIVALGAITAGGISLATALGKSTRPTSTFDAKVPTPKELKDSMSRVLNNLSSEGDWATKVLKGKELAEADSMFFVKMITGDKELGIKGLAETLAEEGYVWNARSADDKFTNWLTDVIKQFDPQDAKSFLDEFETKTGILMPKMANEVQSIEQFANTFARKASDAGRVLGALGNTARVTGKPIDDITTDNYVRAAAGLPLKSEEPGRVMKFLSEKTGFKTLNEFFENKFGVGATGVRNFQNNVIKGIVAHTGTAMLNLKGWHMMTTFNSIDDTMSFLLHGSVGSIQKVFGASNSAAKNFEMAGHLWRNQKVKAGAIMNPDLTVDAVSDYASKRGKFVGDILGVIRGDVDAGEILYKNGFDPKKTVVGQAFDAYTDINLALSLAKGADVLTNSVEFYVQMDKKLRQTYGKGWNEFMELDKAAKVMASPEYRKLEASAVYETRRAVMSQTMKDDTITGSVAGFIEDFRNIPGIGVLMPFGRFFNNQIATAVEFTPVVPQLSKALFGKFEHKTYKDLVMRNLSAASAVGSFYLVGQNSQEKNLGLFEAVNRGTGEVYDFRYEYPLGPIIGLGRLMAMRNEYGEVPENASKEFVEVVGGQMTRELSTSLEGVYNLITEFSKGNLEGFEILAKGFQNITSTVVSGATRTYEPANVVFGLLQGAENTYADKRQGNETINESLRYIGEFVEAASGEPLAPQKYTASQGKQVPSVSKFVGFRAGQTQTAFQQLMNSIGTSEFRALSNYSKSAASDNRYNMLFNELVEAKSSKLLDSPRWTESNLEQRQFLFKQIVESTRDSVYRVMETDLLEYGDKRLVKMFKLSQGKSLRTIDKALQELFPEQEKEFKDLTEKEVEQLELYFRHRDTWLKESTE